MTPHSRHKAIVRFISTNGQQALLEGDFTSVSIGDEFIACTAIGKREPAANLVVRASWQSLAIADITAYDAVNPWLLLGWIVTCGEAEQ